MFKKGLCVAVIAAGVALSLPTTVKAKERILKDTNSPITVKASTIKKDSDKKYSIDFGDFRIKSPNANKSYQIYAYSRYKAKYKGFNNSFVVIESSNSDGETVQTLKVPIISGAVKFYVNFNKELKYNIRVESKSKLATSNPDDTFNLWIAPSGIRSDYDDKGSLFYEKVNAESDYFERDNNIDDTKDGKFLLIYDGDEYKGFVSRNHSGDKIKIKNNYENLNILWSYEMSNREVNMIEGFKKGK